MAEHEEVGRRREIKSLLEQIQQLPHNEGQAAAAQAPANPYYEQWSAYHAAYLAAANTVRRPPSRNALNPWFLVLATGLNTVVAAVLAVLITLSVVRQEPQRASDAASNAPVPPDARSGTGARTAMMLVDPAPTASSSRPVELQPLGSPEKPLRLEALKPSLLPLTVQPEEALADTFILVLSGLPAKADLQGAERIGSDAWLVPPNSLTRLQLTMPEWSSSLIEVGVELGARLVASPAGPRRGLRCRLRRSRRRSASSIKRRSGKSCKAVTSSSAGATLSLRERCTNGQPGWEARRRHWRWARPTTRPGCGHSGCSEWWATRTRRASGTGVPISSDTPVPRIGSDHWPISAGRRRSAAPAPLPRWISGRNQVSRPTSGRNEHSR